MHTEMKQEILVLTPLGNAHGKCTGKRQKHNESNEQEGSLGTSKMHVKNKLASSVDAIAKSEI